MTPDPIRELAARAMPPRPIPDWWSEEDVGECVSARHWLEGLAPDLAVVAADLAEALLSWRLNGDLAADAEADIDLQATEAALAAYDKLAERAKARERSTSWRAPSAMHSPEPASGEMTLRSHASLAKKPMARSPVRKSKSGT